MAWISAEFRSKTLNMPVEAEILVPQPGYKRLTQTEGYKVIILLHGANNDRTEWLLKSQIFDMVKELPILVFLPSGKNSFYVNTANGYPYMDFITLEIPRFIKDNFRVSKDRNDWLIAGESMGGYGALTCGLNHTEQFGNVAAFSGALDILSKETHLPVINMELIFGNDWEKTALSNYNLYRLCHLIPEENKPRIFLNCGRQDRLYEMNVRFYQEIRDAYDVTYTDGDGNHNFNYWNERLKEMIAWFMGGAQEEEVLP
ncbi:MAG: hypothetical protein J6C84_09055 [Lachnospiraceae bacterium]|nr:hypothetical protein [Lachnospiraceae bacterium]